MAINFVAGRMLQSDLIRDANLAFNTTLLTLDIVGNRVGVNTATPNVALQVIGNAWANNFLTSGVISATGNITGNNLSGGIVNATTVSVIANVTGGNLLTSGLISATSNIQGGNLQTTGLVSATGNVQGGNVNTGGLISATANITGGNILTGGLISATSNIVSAANVSGGNILTGGLISATGNLTSGNVSTVDITVSGTSNFGNLSIANTTISSTTANANIVLTPNGVGEVVLSGNTGMVVPVGTTAQRPDYPSYANTAQGTLRFNTTTLQLEVFDGSNWDSATGDTSIITNQTISPDGSTVTYTLDQSTTADAILVSINGISQTPSVDYTVVGNSITFTTTPLTSDIVQVRFIASTTAISGVTLPIYTTTQAQSLSSVATGELIYVSDGANGSPCLAVYSSGAFKRINLAGNISAT